VIDLSAYSELHNRTDAAYRQFAEVALAAFEELRKVDPELTQIAIDAYGRADVVAMSFAQPYGRDRKSIYAELAAGEREEVRSEMLKAIHGIF